MIHAVKNTQSNHKNIVSTAPGDRYRVLGEVAASSQQQIAAAVTQARSAQPAWQALSLDERRQWMLKLRTAFADRADDIAQSICDEVGKTKPVADSEMEAALNKFDWFIDNVETAIAPQTTFEDDNTLHQIHYEPYGVAAVIAPWNYPASMFVWGVVPNLLVGNAVVFKHSEECPLTAKIIDEAFASVDLPSGVFTQVFGDRSEGAYLIDQPINLIWFTGSSAAGETIYSQAGRRFMPAVMELGGSNAGIVFEDTPIKEFAEKIVSKRFQNNGQSCDALKRLLVHSSIFDDCVAELKEVIESKKFGSNNENDSDIGPVAAKRQLDLLKDQVDDAVRKGAKAITGGSSSTILKGAYFEPTLLTNISSDMRIWTEEVFGPVLSVIPFDSEQEAIEIANGTDYGLGALVFSQDLERAHRVAGLLHAGTVEINHAVHWLSCNPFGGYKKSGMGREHGLMGFHELCQVKVISSDKAT